MRDISSDLRERLDLLGAERLKVEAKLKGIQALEGSLKLALAAEEENRLSTSPQPVSLPTASIASLTQVIRRVLLLKNRPLILGEILREVQKQNFDFAEKSPGRAVHGGLMSMLKSGEVERASDGRWLVVVQPQADRPQTPRKEGEQSLNFS